MKLFWQSRQTAAHFLKNARCALDPCPSITQGIHSGLPFKW